MPRLRSLQIVIVFVLVIGSTSAAISAHPILAKSDATGLPVRNRVASTTSAQPGQMSDSMFRFAVMQGTTGITSDAGQTCALMATEGSTCWGNNDEGSSGAARPWSRATPVAGVELETYFISGQVRDSRNAPVAGLTISTTAGTTLTDASGTYTLTNVVSGTYVITPVGNYQFWPASHTVRMPPNATGQDFTAYTVFKQVTPDDARPVHFGDPLTYTLRIFAPDSGSLRLYDNVPTYTTYLTGSLQAPPGISYDLTAKAISGTLTYATSDPLTVSFAVQVGITGTADFAPVITNRACVFAVGSGLADCLGSNAVWNFTYVWANYLPAVLRHD